MWLIANVIQDWDNKLMQKEVVDNRLKMRLKQANEVLNRNFIGLQHYKG